MENLYKCLATLTYDPVRGKMKTDPWWLLADVDMELTRYYRWWVKKEMGIELKKPSWDAHATVVRGIEPPHKKAWKKHAGRVIELKLKPIVRRSGDTTGWDRPHHYWFVDVFSEELSEIMVELGFPEKTKYHITIGRTYE